MDAYKKSKKKCLCSVILWVIVEVLPVIGLLGFFSFREKVSDSRSKSPVKCFQGHNFRAITAFDDVISKLNGTYQEVECFGRREFLENSFLQSRLLIMLMILLILFQLILLLLEPYDPLFQRLMKHNQTIFQARGMSSNEKFETANSSTSTQQNESKPYIKMARQNVLNLHEDVDGINIFNEDVDDGTIPLLLDDQINEYSTSPEANVLPEQVLVEIV